MKVYIVIAFLIALIIFALVIYLTWENRNSNVLQLKVLSFFVVGLLSILLTILLQEQKEDIEFSTTSSLIVDSEGLPYILSNGIDKKDSYMIRVLSTINNDIKQKISNKDEYNSVYFDLFTRTFIHFLEEIYSKGWYINYDYNELTNTTRWGAKESLGSERILTQSFDLYDDKDFNALIPGIHEHYIEVPEGVKLSLEVKPFQKLIVFKNKYMTYSIQLLGGSFHMGLGKHSKLIKKQGLSTYYYEIKTLCQFNKLYPNNPMIKKYQEWVETMNDLIDSHFNTLKSLETYEVNPHDMTRLITWDNKS